MERRDPTQDLKQEILSASTNLEYKKIHISLPVKLLGLMDKRYPYGVRSRIISIALIERIERFEKERLDSLRMQQEIKLIENTDWEGVYKSFETYPGVNGNGYNE